MSSVDAFIEQAEGIYEKFKKTSTPALNAKKESHALLKQFEKYLKAKGLKAPSRARRAHQRTI